MKFIRRHGQTLRFELGKRERRLLIHALQLYPQLDVAHQRLANGPAATRHAAAEELRREILSDHQRANQHLVAEFIRDQLGGSGEPADRSPFALALTGEQSEWLLQVLNDVRVGAWVRLGEPDEVSLPALSLTVDNVALLAAMEYCAYFQSVLLEVLGQAD